jgi:FkbM family methyltransferase
MVMLLDLPMDHASALARMKQWGIEFDTFFDIGAARGHFGEKVRNCWPQASIVFFEAASYWTGSLEKMRRKLGDGVSIVVAAAGKEDGEMDFRFDPDNPLGGGLVEKPDKNTQRVPVIALDSYIRQWNVNGRLALKLDVHGAEQAILSGAKEFMSRCEFLIFETYNFGPAHRRFGQMAVLLEEDFGMRCIDIVEPKWRPYDSALWQMDFYFARYEGTKLSEWRL